MSPFGFTLLLATSVAAVVFVAADESRLQVTALVCLRFCPCAAILVSLRRYRPENTGMWRLLALHFAAAGLQDLSSALVAWTGGSLTFFNNSIIRFVLGVVSCAAAVAAAAALLLMRRRNSATWAKADAAVIGSGLFVALLIVTILPLADRLGMSLPFWSVGVLYSVEALALIVASVALLYSEQFRRGAPLVMVLGFTSWGVFQMLFLQIGTSTDRAVLRNLLLSGLVLSTVIVTAVVVHPAMRDVHVPSNTPRPTWTVGRTLALATSLMAPVAAIWVQPPVDGTQWAVVLIAWALLMLTIVWRLRSAVLQAHELLGQLEILADHDPLTHLPNRRYLYGTFLEGLVRRADRNQPVTLVVNYLDLDNLREVNDRLQHTGGDRLLRAVSDRLRETKSEHQQVVRVGGDEFVMLSPLSPTEDPATAVIRSELQMLQALETLAANGFESRGSVGTSWGRLEPGRHAGEEPGRLLDQLLQEADLAQAEAKRAGGARGVVYDPAMSDRSRTRAALRRSLPGAWAGGEMKLAYQSVVDLRTGEVFGVESLLRWHHPELGDVDPPDAIETAVALGLIGELGLQILARAQQDIVGSGVPPGVRVGVNVSAPQLRPEAIDSLIGAVQETGLAGRVWLEVTEQMLVQEQRYVAGALGDLRAAGLLVAIDDFGSGYCGLDYLCSLPIDLIKLDKTFAVHAVDPIRRKVSRTVAQLADSLGAEVVAEGIEILETAEVMGELGCRYGQGYALRRPSMSIDEAVLPVQMAVLR